MISFTKRHNERIDDLVRERGVRTRGFKQALIRECDAKYLKDEIDYSIGLVPDAYLIHDHRDDEEWFKYLVTVIEIENTSPVTEEKMSRYCDLFWILDQDYITIELEIHTRLGQRNVLGWKDIRELSTHPCPWKIRST